MSGSQTTREEAESERAKMLIVCNRACNNTKYQNYRFIEAGVLSGCFGWCGSAEGFQQGCIEIHSLKTAAFIQLIFMKSFEHFLISHQEKSEDYHQSC